MTSKLTPDRNGTLRLAEAAAPNQWDPLFPNAGASSWAYFEPLYDMLTQIGPNPRTFVPSLATSWKFSNHNKTITWTIRKGVTFSDGESLNAAAVALNFTRIVNTPTSQANPQLVGLTSATATGPYTVVMQFNQDATNIPLIIASNYSTGIACPNAIANPANLATHPCGSGAYVLVSYNSATATYQRSPVPYWDKTINANSPQNLQISGGTNQTARINGLVSGQYDAISLFNPVPSDFASVPPTFQRHIYAPGGSETVYEFNANKPPLNDPRVVKAISETLNRQALTTLFANGTAIPTVQLAVPGESGYVSALAKKKALAPNLADARKLMAAAGFASGFSTSILTLTAPSSILIATVVQQQLAQININVSIHAVPANSGAFWIQGQDGIFSTSPNGAGGDVYPAVNTDYLTTNHIGTLPAKVTQLLNKASSLPLATAKRDAAWGAFETYVAAHPVIVPVLYTRLSVFSTHNVLGLGTPGFGGLSAVLDPRYLSTAS